MATPSNDPITGILINISYDAGDIKYSIYETTIDSGATPQLGRELTALTPLNPNSGTSQITTSLIKIFNENISSLPEIYQKTYKYKNTTAFTNVMGRQGAAVANFARQTGVAIADASKKVINKFRPSKGGYTRNKKITLNRTLKN